jgi:hypothetical protein
VRLKGYFTPTQFSNEKLITEQNSDVKLKTHSAGISGCSDHPGISPGIELSVSFTACFGKRLRPFVLSLVIAKCAALVFTARKAGRLI